MKIKKIHNEKEYVLDQNVMTGKMDLYIDGEKCGKVKKKVFYGNETIYTVKGSFVSGATLVSKDDVIVLYKNKPWETLLIFLPCLYMGLGIFCGAIGGGLAGFFAALCACLNANYIRGEGKTSKKVLISLGLFVGLFIAWFVIYVMIVGVLATLIQAGQ